MGLEEIKLYDRSDVWKITIGDRKIPTTDLDLYNEALQREREGSASW